MKKSFVILICAAALLPLNSCFKQEDDIWEQSSAQRTEAAINNYYDLLTSSENGWVLQYFSNEMESGYPIVMKFDAHKNVTMAANNAVSSGGSYVEQSSNYEIISDQGPVLTFDTSNSLLHTFADPSSDGIGHSGDYEFVVTKVSENQDTIYLVGKKHYLNMRLIEFPMGASYISSDGTDAKVETWADYFTAYNAVKDRLLASELPLLFDAGEGERYEVTGLDDGFMYFLPVGADAELDVAISHSYIMTLDGTVFLSSPFMGTNGALNYQEFYFGEDGLLHSYDDKAVFKAYPASDLFMADGAVWRIDSSSCTGNMSGLYQSLVDGCRSEFNQTLQYLEFSYDASDQLCELTFRNGRYTGKFYFNVDRIGDNAVEFEYSGECNQVASVHVERVPAFMDFINELCASDIALESDSPLNVKRIEFTSSVFGSFSVLLN